ncbi:MAG: polyprenyl synthetase family protein [Pyrinomonadaceae bacterium]
MIPETENLESFIKAAVALVDQKLDQIVPAENLEPVNLHRAIRHSLFAGGKRFRPAFVFAVGSTFGVSNERLLGVASAIEMIHTYSLIHDDLPAMDDDDLRRGRATCHVKFGEATAILAGDALETIAFQVLAEDEGLSPEIRVRIISEVARGAGTPSGMVSGQQVDLESEGKDISVAELEQIHRGKTGAMIRASARAAAIIGEANESDLNAITVYAENLGLLFQVTDDLLDVTQTTEVLGKTAGKDLLSEKATYPSFYGLEGTRRLAEKIHGETVACLDEIEKPTRLLRGIADYILNRKK